MVEPHFPGDDGGQTMLCEHSLRVPSCWQKDVLEQSSFLSLEKYHETKENFLCFLLPNQGPPSALQCALDRLASTADAGTFSVPASSPYTHLKHLVS